MLFCEAKVCSKCGVEKSINEFHIKRESKDGRRNDCARCVGKRVAVWSEKNRGEIAKKRQDRYAKNPAPVKARAAKRRLLNPDALRIKDAEWRAKNEARCTANRKKWKLENKEKQISSQRKWAKANLDYGRAKSAAYHASKLRAIPSWSNKFFVDEAYNLAALRTSILGFEWHVDHIVPLRSRMVCGLHVEQNLRVVPGIVNRSKGNRMWPDMP